MATTFDEYCIYDLNTIRYYLLDCIIRYIRSIRTPYMIDSSLNKYFEMIVRQGSNKSLLKRQTRKPSLYMWYRKTIKRHWHTWRRRWSKSWDKIKKEQQSLKGLNSISYVTIWGVQRIKCTSYWCQWARELGHQIWVRFAEIYSRKMTTIVLALLRGLTLNYSENVPAMLE